ncbi:chorion peroxidase [Daphnia magna]|uniref:chorion peroxidase n=1 Tax=Daphnia magna TaxID=35525 RepID=UPI001401FB5A|nr:chorion peroxidase [Daphnia magna]
MLRPILAGRCPCHILIILMLANSLTSQSVASEVKEPELDVRSNNNEELDRNYLATLIERFDALAAAAKKEEQEAEEMVASIPTEQIEEALRFGQQYVEEWKQLEQRIAKEDENRFMLQGTSDKNGGTLLSPAAKYSARFAFIRHNPAAMAQSKEAAVDYVARQYLSDRLAIPAGKIGSVSRLATSSNATDRQAELPPLSPCDFNSKFRTVDGSCNSNYQPRFGQAGTIFQRLLDFNIYADNVARFRVSVNGQPLPSPRLISTTIVLNDTVPDPSVTLLTMQWGQFLDHDLTLTPTFTKSDGSAVECCSRAQIGRDLFPPPHPECAAIMVPTNDPKYNPDPSSASVTCMNFVRSTFGKDLSGNIPRTRQHVNALTHWIDGSNVYGSSASHAAALRDLSSFNGKLKVSFINGRQFLPPGPNCCPGGAGAVWPNVCTSTCFDAGDERVNEQPLLTVMHTIWVREHNRIADALYRVAPGQSSEFYYQQARRFVIAEMQHIIYNEYLPVMIGPELAAQVNSPEYYYLSHLNPAIFTEFSTAAFRMGHSQLRSFIRLFQSDGRRDDDQSFLLSNAFNEPQRILSRTFLDNSLRGMLQTPAQAVDHCFADDITSQLFKPAGQRLGFDLISLNIQRGRDHGLPPYVWMLYYLTGNYLQQSLPFTFDQLVPRIPLEVVSAMKNVYAHPRDIDLFVGGVSEKPLPKAVLGPTFASMFALQFVNLRRADRFFYSFNLPFHQFAEIQKVSLAKIICDNSDGTITNIQPKAFRVPDNFLNKPVPCGNLPGIDFTKLLPL